MTVGFLMLAHEGLDRAASVAAHLSQQGAPVLVHLDRRVSKVERASFSTRLSSGDRVEVIQKHRCEWGTWQIVQAALDGVARLLQDQPTLTHVILISGACLPLRPVPDLVAYLADHPDTDFIESVAAEHASWTKGGLDAERFTLAFPFGWKRSRTLFDLSVGVQRRLRIQRPAPEGVPLHIGSQWWCLTRDTLSRILNDPDRRPIERFFRRVWIPDESYFQSMVRRHARQIESRSLTLCKFDFQGKPHIFYDDHLELLRQSDRFFARKIWRGSDRLYQAFLGGEGLAANRVPPNPARIDRHFEDAHQRRTRGRSGLYMAGRFPNAHWENGKTAAAYTMLLGVDGLFKGLEDWLRTDETVVHGNLFAPEGAQFSDGGTVFSGGVSAHPALRDYNPEAFLANLVRNMAPRRQVFHLAPRDQGRIVGFVASDRNARVLHVRGGWIVPLFLSGRPAGELRHLAAEYQAVEERHRATLSAPWAHATRVEKTLAEVLADPREILDEIQRLSGARATPGRPDPRGMALAGLPDFVRALRNEGFYPISVGDLDILELPRRPGHRRRIQHRS